MVKVTAFSKDLREFVIGGRVRSGGIRTLNLRNQRAAALDKHEAAVEIPALYPVKLRPSFGYQHISVLMATL
jgi:hypothetical protein